MIGKCLPIAKFAAALLSVSAVAATAGPSGSAAADETSYLQRFSGSWSGSGSVQRKAEEGAKRVRCRVKGSSSQTSLSMSGTCRAALVFTREIGVEVRADPATGRYAGTYTGASIGPARVSGRRQGDTVTLTITWPKPVNGDTKATMTIRNDGSGRLSIAVTDKMPDGRQVQTTNLTFSKSA